MRSIQLHATPSDFIRQKSDGMTHGTIFHPTRRIRHFVGSCVTGIIKISKKMYCVSNHVASNLSNQNRIRHCRIQLGYVSLFRRPIIPPTHCSDSPLFRRPIVPTAHCSDHSYIIIHTF